MTPAFRDPPPFLRIEVKIKSGSRWGLWDTKCRGGIGGCTGREGGSWEGRGRLLRCGHDGWEAIFCMLESTIAGKRGW